ncbi:hypothetical protein [Chitinophaga agri]|uniref:Uncharacterized protein n=1 Tax=Chitinophaga agri TaxID=2703787 RepID=A0A6B9ZH97_9BACT|nr:hypothetical protein [Chitinophaga agri]QHS60871.1 hypothetical protein GWR21_15095 [Chitinophaga agri]
MADQPSIFGDEFNGGIPVRRRELLSLFLKIYIWLGMSVSCLFSLLLSITLVMLLMWPSEDVRSSGWLPVIAASIFLMIAIITLFLMTFLVWREVKWAIKFNGIVAGCWLLFSASCFAIYGLSLLLLFIPFLVFLPYWIFLFRIQRKWEQ